MLGRGGKSFARDAPFGVTLSSNRYEVCSAQPPRYRRGHSVLALSCPLHDNKYSALTIETIPYEVKGPHCFILKNMHLIKTFPQGCIDCIRLTIPKE